MAPKPAMAECSHALKLSPVTLMTSRPSRRSRWLVVLALLLATLMPALSQALASARGEVAAWSQICRASVVSPRAGQSLLAAKAAGDKESLHGLFEHCPYCSLHAQDLAAPPAPTAAPALRLNLAQQLPERFLSAAITAHCWAPALARGPPTAA